jgi:hypothetical protein
MIPFMIKNMLILICKDFISYKVLLNFDGFMIMTFKIICRI